MANYRIYLLKYNNYFNRKLMRYDTISEYPNKILYPYEVNFEYRDGISTTLVLNTAYIEDDLFDYMLVEDITTNLFSRWFIIESSKIVGGQFRFKLRRDVLAEHITDILEAPCYIEKATLKNNNPLIFNNEDLKVNQIKKREYLLRDNTGCPWIVLYLAKAEDQDYSFEVELTQTPNLLSISDYSNYLNKTVYFNRIGYYSFNFKIIYSDGSTEVKNIKFNDFDFVIDSEDTTLNTCYEIEEENYNNILGNISTSEFKTIFSSNFTDNSLMAYIDDEELYEDIKALDRKVYQSGSTLYEIDVEYGEDIYDNEDTITHTTIIETLANLGFTTILDTEEFKVVYDMIATTVNYIEVPETIYFQVDNFLNEDYFKYSSDTPYLVLALPYSSRFKTNGSTRYSRQMTKSQTLGLVNGICQSLGSSVVYDMQLLPYCPIDNVRNNSNWNGYDILTIGTYASIAIRSYTDSDLSTLYSNYIFLICQKASFSFNITLNIEVTDNKLSTQLDLYRLNSPNFNGSFDIDLAFNGGLTGFNVDCDYKPYQPYIHINPIFKKLYGHDFNDPRGLICNGDFSLTQVSSAWAEYQMNNKNYQEIFNRQIQYLKTQNTLSTISSATSIISNGLMGGAVAGLGGAIAGVGAGIADTAMTAYQGSQQVSYQTDLYNYNLQNIQAQPMSLTKVSAFNRNNKVFPILEYYTCTMQERQAFIRKLKYNGMTVNKIDLIKYYLWDEMTYIKGQLIRLNIIEDSHYLGEVYNEVYKGFFINNTYTDEEEVI